jgi:ferritin-like metal-binding protein YciE
MLTALNLLMDQSGGVTMEMNNLENLYIEELRDLYDAERQLLNTLPKLEQAAHSNGLKHDFQEHYARTQQHKQRLEQIFQDRNESPDGKRCVGMQGIIQEGEQILQNPNVDPAVEDAALIASAQKAEHYEIAGYGTVRTYAKELGFGKHARVLDMTLDEESDFDKQLTSIAEDRINEKAEAR